MLISRGNGPPFRHQRTLGSKYKPAYAGWRKILHPCNYTINQSEHFPELLLPASFPTILGRLGKNMHHVGKISLPYQVFILLPTQNVALFWISVMTLFARFIISHASLGDLYFP